MDDQTFVAAIRDKSFPLAEFNHLAHLKLAYILLDSMSLNNACSTVNRYIQDYATFHGVPEKFHHTITASAMLLMHDRIQRQTPESFVVFCDQNDDLVLDLRSVLLRHYHQDTLFSNAARMAFMEPDLAPLPSLSRED